MATNGKKRARVVDLIDDEGDLEEKQVIPKSPDVQIINDEDDAQQPAAKKRRLAYHMTQTITVIMDNNPDMDKEVVTSAVKSYCKQNPRDYNVQNIAGAAFVMVLEGVPLNDGKNDAEDEEEEENEDEVAMEVSDEPNPVMEILKIFPDANQIEVEKLLRKCHDNVGMALQTMMDHGYEKVKPSDQCKQQTEKGTNGNSNNRKPPSHDFISTTWETTRDYRTDALSVLQWHYPFLRKDSLERLFRFEGKYHYTATLKKLEEITTIQSKPYPPGPSSSSSSGPGMKGWGGGMISLTFSKEQITKIKDTIDEKTANDVNFLKNNLKLLLRMSVKNLLIPNYETLDDLLQEEISWLQASQQQEMLLKDTQIAEELNYQLAADENQLIECGCCYSDYPFEKLIQCTEGHLFCKNCLQHYAEQQVFGQGQSSLKCMDTSGEACLGVFTEHMLRASLPEKVLAKFSEAQARDVLKAVQLNRKKKKRTEKTNDGKEQGEEEDGEEDDEEDEDEMCLITCFACELQVDMSQDKHNKILHCPNRDCSRDTCRECGREAHIPLKCKEVEDKKDTNKRVTIEEAMTQARIRECPKCKTKFFKTEGCNKMTCTTCGSFSCYICRKDICKEKYQHFCQTPFCNHTTCGKCKLYTDSIEDDNRAMLEAGLKTLKELEREEAEKGNTAGGSSGSSSSNNKDNNKDKAEGPTIDIEKYLERPAPKAARKA